MAGKTLIKFLHKMIKKRRTEDWLLLILEVVIIILFYAIISDWANFKAGLFGKSPV